jgi:hypothetical protein
MSFESPSAVDPPVTLLDFSFFGFSAINASLVSNSVRDAGALARAVLVTLVGSITPAFDQVFVDVGQSVVAHVPFLPSKTFSQTIPPS